MRFERFAELWRTSSNQAVRLKRSICQTMPLAVGVSNP